MENPTSYCGEERNLNSKSVQIRLMGHCIICLRKVNSKRIETSENFTTCVSPEMAPKSVVSAPGFLATFNQVWTVLQTKWKEKNNPSKSGSGSSNQIGISLENVLQSGRGSANVSFCRAPTICRYCCDKVLAVENLMKAVRQQVREINLLLEEGRRRQDGGLGEFEKSLREEGLEESVIRATLQFVGIFDYNNSQNELGVSEGHDDVGSETMNMFVEMSAKCDEKNELDYRIQVDYDDGIEEMEGQIISGAENDDDDSDPDYLKEEPEEGDNDESTDDEDEEEMEFDEVEDKNDPEFKVGKDPLATRFPDKCTETPSKRRKLTKQHGKGSCNKKNEIEEDSSMFPCSCGKKFETFRKRAKHMGRCKKIDPEFKACNSKFNRQICDLCGEWVMYSDILEHLTGVHLNGQVEWVIKCPNGKCRYLSVSSKELNTHLHNGKKCKKVWKEKGGRPVCEICGFKGANMFKIWNHVRDKHENGEEKKWKCPISGCGKMFFVKQSVHYHLSEHRYQPPITQQNCDKCGEDLKVEEMEGHLREEHGILEVIGCKQCGMKFSGREEMVEHLYEHRGSGIRCDICGEDRFGRYGDFREHYFGVHKLCPKKYKCGEGDCENWYWRKEDKEMHELRMHKESKVSERYKQSLVERKTEGEKQFECEVCNVKFVKDDNLISHNIKVHGAEAFKCDICEKTFEYRHKFIKHKKEHAGVVFQKEWKCEVEGCGKVFREKKGLKRHKEVGHGAVKPHVCDICGKGYCDPSSLKDHHNIVHLGIRAWICEECGERFASSTILKLHKRIHTGERPFECEICGQRFRHKGVLGTHKKGHEEKGDSFKPNGPMKQIRKRKAQ